MSHDDTPWLVDAVRPVLDQLYKRLESELGERDELAVLAAVNNAIIAGYRQGHAAVVYAAETEARRIGVPLTLQSELTIEHEDYDLWEAKYGHGSSDEGGDST